MGAILAVNSFGLMETAGDRSLEMKAVVMDQHGGEIKPDSSDLIGLYLLFKFPLWDGQIYLRSDSSHEILHNHIARGKPAESGQEILRRRYRLSTAATPFNGKRILDFGCGNGAQTAFFADQNCDIYAVDIHQSDLDIFSEYLSSHDINNIHPVYYPGRHLPFEDGYFDMVISYEVLEHVQDEGLAMAEINRVLKTGGEVIISVPNKAWIFETHGANLPFLSWNRVPFFSWLPRVLHSRWAKARIYSKRQILRLMSKYDFKPHRVQYITAPMDMVRNRRLKHWLRKTIFRGDTTCLPFLATAILVYGQKRS